MRAANTPVLALLSVVSLVLATGCSSTRTTAVTPTETDPATHAASKETRAPAVWTDPASGVGFPARLGAADLLGHKRYPQPGLGVSVRYVTAAKLKVDIFVYNGSNPRIPDGADAPVVVAEASHALREIREVARAGHYANLREIRDDDAVFGLGGAKTDFRRVTFVFDQSGAAYDSELYITGYRRNFIKVRATYPVAQRDAGRRDVHELLNALGARLAGEVRDVALLSAADAARRRAFHEPDCHDLDEVKDPRSVDRVVTLQCVAPRRQAAARFQPRT